MLQTTTGQFADRQASVTKQFLGPWCRCVSYLEMHYCLEISDRNTV